MNSLSVTLNVCIDEPLHRGARAVENDDVRPQIGVFVLDQHGAATIAVVLQGELHIDDLAVALRDGQPEAAGGIVTVMSSVPRIVATSSEAARASSLRALRAQG